jgi:hypothetical protein
MNYADYAAALAQMTGLKDVAGQALLNALLPRIVEYAELRCFRDPDLNFLATETTDDAECSAYRALAHESRLHRHDVAGTERGHDAGAISTRIRRMTRRF